MTAIRFTRNNITYRAVKGSGYFSIYAPGTEPQRVDVTPGMKLPDPLIDFFSTGRVGMLAGEYATRTALNTFRITGNGGMTRTDRAKNITMVMNPATNFSRKILNIFIKDWINA